MNVNEMHVNRIVLEPDLRVKRLHPDARIPTYAHDLDAGLDLYSIEDEFVPIPGTPFMVRTGIAVEIEPGYEGQIRPRSGLSATGLIVVPGTVDAGYRGEISVVMYVLHDRRDTAVLRRGLSVIPRASRIAQLVISPVARARVIEVPELSSSERGTGGFGSSGT